MLITKYLLLVPYVIQHLLPIKTEKNITISYYLGRWNQVATSRSTILLGTGVKYKDVTADYDLFNETLLSVCNSGIDNKNNHTSISGYSYITGNSETKRKLHFDGVPVDGNYWIVKLGPIINDTYRYAVVSGAMTR